MTSEKQLKANRRNAKKSTGPKSVEGKARSNKNSTRHGLLSTDAVVPGERKCEFKSFRDQLFDDWQPEGMMEELLVEKIANYAWRLRRAVQAEAQLMYEGMTDYYLPKRLDMFFEGQENRKMSNISRYESMLSRHFYRAVQELRGLQHVRMGSCRSTSSHPLGQDDLTT